MLEKLPTEVGWASQDTFDQVENEIMRNNARGFHYDDCKSYYVEVDIYFPDEIKKNFRK